MQFTISQRFFFDAAHTLRRESRGLHFSRDYPELAAPAAPTLLVPPVA